jgi:hypothetical protein
MALISVVDATNFFQRSAFKENRSTKESMIHGGC